MRGVSAFVKKELLMTTYRCRKGTNAERTDSFLTDFHIVLHCVIGRYWLGNTWLLNNIIRDCYRRQIRKKKKWDWRLEDFVIQPKAPEQLRPDSLTEMCECHYWTSWEWDFSYKKHLSVRKGSFKHLQWDSKLLIGQETNHVWYWVKLPGN